jgi:PHD-like zinc-binding domain
MSRPPDPAVEERDRRNFHASRARLLAHPALRIPGPAHPHRPLAAEPRAVLRSLFADLVQRESASFDAARHPPPQQHVLHEDVAAPVPDAPPLLGVPPDLANSAARADAAACGHDVRELEDWKQLDHVAVHPVEEAFHIPGAAEVETAAAETACLVQTAVARLQTPASVVNAGVEEGAVDLCAVEPETAPFSSVASSEPGARTRNGERRDAGAVDTKLGWRTRRKSAASAGATGGSCSNAANRKHGSYVCCFCPDLSLFDGKELDDGGELLGPFVNGRGIASLRSHTVCANWAPQVYIDSKTGSYRHVYDEYARGRQLRCSGCHSKGATVGCYVEKCKKTFHYRCLDAAGARRVEQFFVAFCSVHAHLADLDSYQLMMEAASIADVASTLRCRDSTHGLDTPHSKYTLLRRGESELIFSARAGIASTPAAFDSTKVIFSSRRRDIIPATVRISVRDRPRRIRASAFNIANGSLALLSLGHSHECGHDASPLQAAAALASKDHSALLLLRNLDRSPDFSPGDITVIKKPSSRAVASQPRTGDRSPLSFDPKANADSSPSPAVACDKKRLLDCVPAMDSLDRTRNHHFPVPDASLSTSLTSALMLNGTSANDARDEPVIKRRVILRIPLSEAGSAAMEQRRESKDKELRLIAEREEKAKRRRLEREDKQRKRKGKEEELRKQASRVVTAPSKAMSSEVPFVVKIRSAWQIFLDEQLPKERALRPDDSMECARRNMARLWGLLASYERAVYEEKAKQSRLGFCLDGSGPTIPSAEGDAAVNAAAQRAAETAAAVSMIRGNSLLDSFLPTVTRSGGGKEQSTSDPLPLASCVVDDGGTSHDDDDPSDDDDKMDAGLFSATVRKAPGPAAPVMDSPPAPTPIALPTRRGGMYSSDLAYYDDNLDDMFPTNLDAPTPSIGVRPPPPLRRCAKNVRM